MPIRPRIRNSSRMKSWDRRGFWFWMNSWLMIRCFIRFRCLWLKRCLKKGWWRLLTEWNLNTTPWDLLMASEWLRVLWPKAQFRIQNFRIDQVPVFTLTLKSTMKSYSSKMTIWSLRFLSWRSQWEQIQDLMPCIEDLKNFRWNTAHSRFRGRARSRYLKRAFE